MDHELHTGEFLAHVAQELAAATEETPTLQRVVEKAVEVVGACDHAAIATRQRNGVVRTVAATSPLAEACDTLQYDLGEGPCLNSIVDDETYLVEDVRNDARWSRWGPRAADLGVGSILSVRLNTDTESLGALNLYAGKPFAFDTDNIDLTLVYALHASTAISAARLITGLETALSTRHAIGVAQGILMNRYGLSMERAFDVLRRVSSHRNIKLREVARMVVETGSLPESPVPDPLA